METKSTGKSALNVIPQVQWIEVDGLKVRYAKNDKTEGDQILLISPWPESIYAFIPTWEAFSALGPVTVIDLPGFGLSEGRPDIMPPEAMGEFLLKVIDALGLHQPHVCAPDVGTPAVLFCSANHPGTFKSMILGSGAFDTSQIGNVLDTFVNAPDLEPYKEWTGEQFVAGALSDIVKYTVPEEVKEDYLAGQHGDRFWQSISFVRDYPTALPRLATRLKDIVDPVQITVGEHDVFVFVESMKKLAAGLPKSKIDILDGGHFVWEDCSVEYARVATSWITGGYAKV